MYVWGPRLGQNLNPLCRYVSCLCQRGNTSNVRSLPSFIWYLSILPIYITICVPHYDSSLLTTSLIVDLTLHSLPWLGRQIHTLSCGSQYLFRSLLGLYWISLSLSLLSVRPCFIRYSLHRFYYVSFVRPNLSKCPDSRYTFLDLKRDTPFLSVISQELFLYRIQLTVQLGWVKIVPSK